MPKTTTSRYDVSEHLRTSEEMAAYLEASLEEANGDAAFIAKALGDIARAKGMSQVARDAGFHVRAFTKLFQGSGFPASIQYSRLFQPLGSNCTLKPHIKLFIDSS